MKTLLFTASFLFAGLAAPVFAQAPAYAGDPVRAVSPERSEQMRHDRSCLHETGTRIKRAAVRCGDRAGRSYDRDDLRRTGATDLGDALQRLDPSITRHRR